MAERAAMLALEEDTAAPAGSLEASCFFPGTCQKLEGALGLMG